jgi:hypothetical protein
MSGAIAGLAISVGTTAMSFINAGKQKRKQQDADRKAAMAMAEVEKELTKNEYKALSLDQTIYEQTQATLGAQIKTEMEALREGDQRGVLAGSQRVQEGTVQSSGAIRADQGQKLDELDKLVADEETRKSDIKMQLKLGDVAGAQQASAEASQAANQLKMQGFQGVGNVLQQGLGMVKTYGKSAEAKDVIGMQREFAKGQKADYLAGTGAFAGQGPKTNREYRQNLKPMMNQKFQQAVGGLSFTGDQFSQFGNIGQLGGLGQGEFSNLDFQQLGGLQGAEFMDQLMQMTPEQRRMLKQQMGF